MFQRYFSCHFPVKGRQTLESDLGHSPAERPQFVHGPAFSHGAIGKANSVAGEQSLGRVQQRAGPPRDSFQNVPGGVKPGPCLVRFWNEDRKV